jgi:hypothetical protein
MTTESALEMVSYSQKITDITFPDYKVCLDKSGVYKNNERERERQYIADHFPLTPESSPS